MSIFVARRFEIDFLQMSASKKGNEEASLESVTKQLAEMKKKIQLLGEYAQSYIFNERASKWIVVRFNFRFIFVQRDREKRTTTCGTVRRKRMPRKSNFSRRILRECTRN